jgi:hypothetical protein
MRKNADELAVQSLPSKANFCLWQILLPSGKQLQESLAEVYRGLSQKQLPQGSSHNFAIS